MPDHWFWCVLGLRGVAQMLTTLLEHKVPPTQKAITELNLRIIELQKIVDAGQQRLNELKEPEAQNS